MGAASIAPVVNGIFGHAPCCAASTVCWHRPLVEIETEIKTLERESLKRLREVAG